MCRMTDSQVGAKRGISFVIRLWLEPREIAGDPTWRWHVQHVQSGEEAHFARLADVLSYIEAKAGLAPPH